MITVYTDGACPKNGYNEVGSGVGVYFPEHDQFSISEHSHLNTNNKAELWAVIRSMQIIRDNPFGVTSDLDITIMTDSNYIVKGYNVYWSAWSNRRFMNVKNMDLWRELKALTELFHSVTIIHVKAHAGIPGNERADELARLGVSS